MLFHTFDFIIFFLPLVCVVYYALGSSKLYDAALIWLIICSLFFYSAWEEQFLFVILFSVVVNYLLSLALRLSSKKCRRKKLILIIGVLFNLTLLSYYKYINFIVDNVNYLFSSEFQNTNVVIPLAISFFTFQQIMYLVDLYRGETIKGNFIHYCLFITFFPQLIAGPIVHHREMMPQFHTKDRFSINTENLRIGGGLFILGMIKKVFFADNYAVYSDGVFNAANEGLLIGNYDAWLGILSFNLQIYFDFSGYTDMAIGLAYLLNIKLPENFNSPYKAVSIIDFWRRWHITLSRFLRDYVYIPLGGNKNGKASRYLNLMTTMLIGGLWHGASWTFVIWGALHGAALIINHSWIWLMSRSGVSQYTSYKKFNIVFGVITLFFVMFSWVFFRAETFNSAVVIFNGVFSLADSPQSIKYDHPFSLGGLIPVGYAFIDAFVVDALTPFIFLFFGYVIVLFMPKSIQLLNFSQFDWKMVSVFIGLCAFLLMLNSLPLGSFSKESDFIYFQF